MDATVVQIVPGASIAGMAVSLIISVTLPIVLLIVWRRKTKASFSSFFIGAGIFILFALILEQILHSVMLGLTGTVLRDNIWLYALYGGLAAGLFEETGRLTAMKFFMKNPDKKNAIMYGIGHGGIEAILITGLNMISNLATSMMINAGQLESILAPLGDEKQTLLAQLSALWTEPSWKFYMAGVERISAVMLHIVMSYLVYMAVKNKKIVWYVLSVLLHAVINAGTILLAQALPVWTVEAILLAVCAALIIAVKKQYLKEPA
ncbi:MAG: YhfC family intramembrane metalloprotease [Acetatifactor sp.]